MIPKDLCWPPERTGEAVAALGEALGWPLRATAPSRASDIEYAAAWAGIEAEPVEAPYDDVDTLVAEMGPALVETGEDGILVVLQTSRRSCTLISPDGRRATLPFSTMRGTLVMRLEKPHRERIDRMLDEISAPAKRRERARRALLDRFLGHTPVRGVTLLRLPASAPFAAQLRHARIGARIGAALGAHALRYVLFTLGFWLIGRAALEGRAERSLLVGWALVVVTEAPLAVLTTWLLGRSAIDAGALLKRRMLFGGLRVGRDELRAEGVGHLLGRVHEAEAVDALALGVGFAAATGFVELVVAMGVLFFGGASVATGVTLAIWTVFVGYACLRYVRRHARWTEARLAMTHDLVERMVGHRTRLAQEPPSRRHDGEDELLVRYNDASISLDRMGATLSAVMPRGWLVVGLGSLVPSLAGPDSSDVVGIAVRIGATLLAYRALRKILNALPGAAATAVAWQKAQPLFSAADREPIPSTAEPPRPREGRLRLEASGITYRYRSRSEPVLRECNLVIDEGDRVLVEGRSGAGKSTLAAILCGLREPDSGLLLLGGLDRQTLGVAGIRRHVASAPQFHENHVLGNTLAFNLLMGSRWPPRAEDLRRAEHVCRDLGLGPLLERMPSGLQTQVGETGWQLSHGERSRVYLARALLQGARVLVLDESFGALDPSTLEVAMRRVLSEPAAVVVIAHP